MFYGVIGGKTGVRVVGGRWKGGGGGDVGEMKCRLGCVVRAGCSSGARLIGLLLGLHSKHGRGEMARDELAESCLSYRICCCSLRRKEKKKDGKKREKASVTGSVVAA